MAKYFSLYPSVFHNNKIVTDIMVRVKARETWLSDPSVYYTYLYKDSDKPEHIAHKYYGDEDLHWIILITNNIFNPNFDFPMSSDIFPRYIEDKYSQQGALLNLTGMEYAQQTPDPIFKYQKMIRKIYGNGTSDIEYFVIDKKSYTEMPFQESYDVNIGGEIITYEVSRRFPLVTILDHEKDVNESKRLIKILNKRFVQQAKDELRKLLR